MVDSHRAVDHAYFTVKSAATLISDHSNSSVPPAFVEAMLIASCSTGAEV
jgi:hypothetical protein